MTAPSGPGVFIVCVEVIPMTRWLRRLAALSAVPAMLLACAACGKSKDKPGPAGMGPPGGPGESRPIGEIMAKLTKGPQSLTSVIGAELNQDPPPWDTLGPQAKEFAQLASTMG